MAQDENSLGRRSPASRRSFVKGLGTAGAVLPVLTALPRWSLAQDTAAAYANASIDWKQFAGQTITLAGAIHPWSNAITPLLPEFTKEALEAELRALADQEGVKPAVLIHPTRMALSAATGGPPLFDLVELVGRAATGRHMGRFIAFLREAGNTAPAAEG